MQKQSNLSNLYNSATVNVNGNIIAPKDASISIFDRGFLYGDSIYEVTYSEKGCLIYFHEHLDRLFNSAEILNMHLFISREEIINEALKTLKHSKIESAYIRIIITRGETEIGLDPSHSFKNNLVIIVKQKPFYPQEMYNSGLKLYIPSIIRNDINAINPNAKSGNYLNNVMAISEAKKAGFDDAIMVNKDGQITEGTSFNIWMISNGIIYTPPKESGLLKGITREKLINICNEEGFNLKIVPFNKKEILNSQEVFITSSTKGIMPVKIINDQSFGESISEWPTTKKLMTLYNASIKQEVKKAEFYYL